MTTVLAWLGGIWVGLALLIVLGAVGAIVRDSLQTRARRPAPDLLDQLRRCGVAPRANPRDLNDETDIATEGGFAPWPGIAAVDAVKHSNPRLDDVLAKAVAIARTRLKAAR